MIRYALRCHEGHGFESWFQSADAFQNLADRNMLSCPRCGSSAVQKALMAPNIGPSHKREPAGPTAAPAAEQAVPRQAHALAAPSSPAEKALRELKQKILENSEYVGDAFATEARRIHLGESPERSIYGEARPDEARALVDEGVPIAPLPFLPTRKSN